MPDQILENAKNRMNDSVDALSRELSKIRTGRANPAILSGIMVEYYGVKTPLSQISSITVPEPQSLLIKPFDRSALNGINKAILESNLGLTPNNDGETIRLNIPSLTAERRVELTKLVRKHSENAKVSIRNIRREANDELKKVSSISEDDVKLYQKEVQDLTDDLIKRLDEVTKEKEDEVKTI
ncbi:ribosome recycling factor [Mycoplasmatota bacterium zrk1]